MDKVAHTQGRTCENGDPGNDWLHAPHLPYPISSELAEDFFETKSHLGLVLGQSFSLAGESLGHTPAKGRFFRGRDMAFIPPPLEEKAN